MLRILERSAAGGDAKARAFVPLFADWLARPVQVQGLRSTACRKVAHARELVRQPRCSTRS